MDNPNPDKVAKVDEIAGKLETAGTVLVTEYRGLDVPAQAQLRAAVKDAGGEFKIYKNTLTKLAAERTGLALDEHLTGPTALAFAYPPAGGQADPVALSKALTEFQKTNDALVIKGGVVDGAVVGPDDVTALSKVPPREEMLAQFAGLLQAPMSQFARLLNAMPTKLAQLTQALIEKGGANSGAADAAAEEPAEPQPKKPQLLKKQPTRLLLKKRLLKKQPPKKPTQLRLQRKMWHRMLHLKRPTSQLMLALKTPTIRRTDYVHG